MCSEIRATFFSEFNRETQINALLTSSLYILYIDNIPNIIFKYPTVPLNDKNNVHINRHSPAKTLENSN